MRGLLILGSVVAYIGLVSAVGKWLAHSRETTTKSVAPDQIPARDKVRLGLLGLLLVVSGFLN